MQDNRKKGKSPFSTFKSINKELTLMDSSELKLMQKPINQANYKADHKDIYQAPYNNGYIKTGRPKKDPSLKAQPTDRIYCEICGGEFTRYNRSAHNKTRVHQALLGVNHKLREFLIEK